MKSERTLVDYVALPQGSILIPPKSGVATLAYSIIEKTCLRYLSIRRTSITETKYVGLHLKRRPAKHSLEFLEKGMY